MTIRMKEGDERPPVEAQLLDANGDPIDLSGSSVSEVRFLMEDGDTNQTIVDSTAEIDNATNGDVVYRWNDGDTDTPGHFESEFRVVFSSNNELTVPTQGFIDVYIERSIQ